MSEEQEEPQPYTFTLPDGSTLEGSENYTGQATAVYENGDQYVGGFVSGLREGSGVYTWKSGAVYTGKYSVNVRNGRGKLTYPDGSWFDGLFADGQRIYGTARYANGDAYHGNFANGHRHGPNGVYIFQISKSRLIGTWANGAILEGVWKLHSGQTWTGNFHLNKPSGEGVWHLHNNDVHGSYSIHKAPVDFAPDNAHAPPTKITAKWKSVPSTTFAASVNFATSN